jgi:hypothetical protein
MALLATVYELTPMTKSCIQAVREKLKRLLDFKIKGNRIKKPMKYRRPPIVKGPISLRAILTNMNEDAQMIFIKTASTIASRWEGKEDMDLIIYPF